MLKEDLSKKNMLLDEVASLGIKIKSLENDLFKKRETLRYTKKLMELEYGDPRTGSTLLPMPNSEAVTLRENSSLPLSAATLIPIYVYYKGQRYDAELDQSRIHEARGSCVYINAKWMTTSAAGNSLPTKNFVNGWRFWKYKRTDGTTGVIEELRQIPNVGIPGDCGGPH